MFYDVSEDYRENIIKFYEDCRGVSRITKNGKSLVGVV